VGDTETVAQLHEFFIYSQLRAQGEDTVGPRVVPGA
jgi:hypothetical protein